MRDRPLEHRGLLRAIRRHSVARLCVALALFTYVLVGISPLWGPAVERGGIELCTANGIRVIPADLPVSGAPDGKQNPKRDCPLCTIHAAPLLTPADCSIEVFCRVASAVTCPEPSRVIAGVFAGFDHFSRAPPLLS